MPFLLDHVFVMAPRGARAANHLVDAGLIEGPGNVHPGQGTANRRFWFLGGMLELLWVHDELEVRSELTRRTGLWERSRWEELDACPFGVCWRPVDGEARNAPFPAWAYTPAYLPEGAAIPMAVASEAVSQPLGFALPAAFAGAADPPEQPHTPRHIEEVVVSHPVLLADWMKPELADRDGRLRFEVGETRLELRLEGARRMVDLTVNGIPLVVHL